MPFLEVFLKVAAKVYRKDDSSPGIVVSWLEDKNCWYASLQRYPDGVEKVIQAKAFSETSVSNALLSLAWVWGNQRRAHPLAFKLAHIKQVRENSDLGEAEP